MNNSLIKLAKLPYFRTSHFEQYLPHLKKDSIYQKISRWLRKEEIINLKKGYYTTKIYHDKHINDLNYIYYVANILRYPSYVSGIYVLQNYDVLTDITYPITSMTTKTTRKYVNKLGNFIYYSITPKLYDGYERLTYENEPIYVATLAKALFDYLYIKYFRSNIEVEEIIIKERLNLEKFNNKDVEEFFRYCKLSGNKNLFNLGEKLFK